MKIIVHKRVNERHPEIQDNDVIYAWLNYRYAATRIPGEQEIRTGFDLKGRELEMVGVLTEEGWLVYHAMTPPSKKTRKEIRQAKGGKK